MTIESVKSVLSKCYFEKFEQNNFIFIALVIPAVNANFVISNRSVLMRF